METWTAKPRTLKVNQSVRVVTRKNQPVTPTDVTYSGGESDDPTILSMSLLALYSITPPHETPSWVL